MKPEKRLNLNPVLLGITILVSLLLFTQEVGFGQPKKGVSVSKEVRKDPFSLPAGIRLLSNEVPTLQEVKQVQPVEVLEPIDKPPQPTLKLKAILIGDHVRLASIDRFIVTVGDLIHGEKVLEIRPEGVILEKEGKKRTLRLDQSPIKISVEDP